MPMTKSDWRKGRRVGLLILGVFVALFIVASLNGRAGPSLQIQALRDACHNRYGQAHSRGDTVLADAWIPRPELQRGRPFLRCMDLNQLLD